MRRAAKMQLYGVCLRGLSQELVKSHLTFAVREEVGALRARISELAARNTRLELENSLLRRHAALASLQANSASYPPRDDAK